jgi:DNA-binding CsgD family transcriptional regulator
MSLWQRLLSALGLRPVHGSLRFDQTLLSDLQLLAEREQRPTDELAAALLTDALRQRHSADAHLLRWRLLTPREQQVAALVCLGYANAEIAVRLSISLPTVKAHVRNILRKFNLSRRSELQHILSDWDFSAWQD